jgi:hypothetical protein
MHLDKGSELTSEPQSPVATTLTLTCLEEGSLGISRFWYSKFSTCVNTKALFCSGKVSVLNRL